MSYTASIDQAAIQKWLAAKLDPKVIEEQLLAKGFDKDTIAEYLKEFRRLKNAKRQFTGFVWMGIGAFLGFISCVLTLINAVPDLYNVILYGLTSLAIIIIFIGLYFVFE